MKCKFQSEYESYTFILAFVRNCDLSALQCSADEQDESN